MLMNTLAPLIATFAFALTSITAHAQTQPGIQPVPSYGQPAIPISPPIQNTTPNPIQNAQPTPIAMPTPPPQPMQMPPPAFMQEMEDDREEAFPQSQMPQLRPNNTVEPFTPSVVTPALPPVAKSNEIRAVLRTSVGDITIKLDPAHAPMSVAHFVGLARGDKEFIDVKTSKRAKRPFYNGQIFHRVVKGYLIQTGCPFGTGRGGPGTIATVKDESNPEMKFNRPGLVAMAPLRDSTGLKNVKDSNGSQFFISLREMPSWDGQFTIIGEVEDGMDVLNKIAAVKVGPTERPIKRIYLVAVDIIEGASR